MVSIRALPATTAGPNQSIGACRESEHQGGPTHWTISATGSLWAFEILYKSQNPTEQRRLLETVLSNCTFDRGTLCPTHSSPFDLPVKGNESGNWRRERDSNPTGAFL